MSPVVRLLVLAALAVPTAASAQSPSPTLPSDTLEANYAPKSAPGPAPELAPSLPSDTLDAGKNIAPDSSSGEMRRDWDQEESSELRKEDERQGV
jgi:hypothetical protein